jgi:uncharacterized protein
MLYISNLTSTILPPNIQNFVTLLLAIVVESFPFVVIGVAISALVEVWLPANWVSKYLPKNRFLSHFLAAILGFFIPVCECGNVPMVRKLMQKGFGVSHAITFLLSAPIVNPVVWITTREAFNIDPNIAIIRIGSGLVISLLLGILFSYKINQKEWLVDNFAKSCHLGHSHHHEHHDHENHHHDKDEHNNAKNKSDLKTYFFGRSKLTKAFNYFTNELWGVMQMVTIGGILAATVQTFVPREKILEIGQNPFLSVLAMLILAFVVAMCSNVDAFFALSFSGTFNLGSLMTFMVFGPMIDIKVLTMLNQTFKPKFLIQIVTLVILFSLIVGFGTNVFYKQSLYF